MTVSRRRYLALLGTSLAAANCAQHNLVEQWNEIASATDGVVGAAALHTHSGKLAVMNGTESFPLASVCKFPVALRIFNMVDDRILNLNEKIEILPSDVFPSWEGDLASHWHRHQSIELAELIRAMLSNSDNTAVQTLFRIGGEEQGMAASFRHWGVTGIRVDRYEGQCTLSFHGVVNPPPVAQWTPETTEQLIAKVPLNRQYSAMRRFIADPRDTATPRDTVGLLARAFRGQLLSPPSTARLKADMEACSTGNHRLKGLLPPGTVVAHKTGTSGTIEGLNGATNDVGVITLPGKAGQLAIAVYIKGSTRAENTRDGVIARISHAAYNHWAFA